MGFYEVEEGVKSTICVWCVGTPPRCHGLRFSCAFGLLLCDDGIFHFNEG